MGLGGPGGTKALGSVPPHGEAKEPVAQRQPLADEAELVCGALAGQLQPLPRSLCQGVPEQVLRLLRTVGGNAGAGGLSIPSPPPRGCASSPGTCPHVRLCPQTSGPPSPWGRQPVGGSSGSLCFPTAPVGAAVGGQWLLGVGWLLGGAWGSQGLWGAFDTDSSHCSQWPLGVLPGPLR